MSMDASKQELLVLGLVLNGTFPAGAIETLNALHFTGERQRIWEHVEGLRSEGRLTQDALIKCLAEDDKVEDLAKWLSVPRANVDLAPVISRMQDATAKRRLAFMVETAQKALVSPKASAADVAAVLKKASEAVSEPVQGGTHWVNAMDAQDAEVHAIEERKDAYDRGERVGFDTPWPELNQLIGHLIPDLYILLGATGTGKTFAATSMVEHVCRAGGKVAGFTLEMTSQQQAQRTLTGPMVTNNALRSGRLNQTQMGAIYDRADRNAEWFSRWWMDERPGATARRMEIGMADFQRRFGKPDLIVLDHIHLCDLQGEKEVVGYGQLSRAIKGLATTYKCPVLGLSQANRDYSKRKDHRPLKSDIRASGSLEQDAGFIIGLYREAAAKPHACPVELLDVGEMIVLKARYGTTGTARVQWNTTSGGWVHGA